MQAANLQPFYRRQQFLKRRKRHPQFGRNFTLLRFPPHALDQALRRLFYFACFAAQLARRPVHPPQTVQDGSSNPHRRITAKQNFFTRIEFVVRVDQSHHARAHQVVELHLLRQPLQNAIRHHPYQRQMLQQNPFAVARRLRRCNCCRCRPTRLFFRGRQRHPFERRQHAQRNWRGNVRDIGTGEVAICVLTLCGDGQGVSLFTPSLSGLESRSQQHEFNRRTEVCPPLISFRHTPPRPSHFRNQRCEIFFKILRKRD